MFPIKKNKPLVSAVIPTFNRAVSIMRAVESVLNQKYEPLELIVVDDGSEDETGILLKKINKTNFFLIRQANQGVSSARNQGIKKARGEFIAFLDSDDEWLPGKIEAQINFFKENPTSVLVQTQEKWIRNGRFVNPKRKHLKKAGDIFIDSLKLCLISPSAVMIKKSLFDEVGLFNENLPACEDYELWLRILLNHQADLIDKEYLLRHGGHADQLSAQHSLDKYRIAALEEIIKFDLSEIRQKAVLSELERRRSIYEAGQKKRRL